MLTGGTSADVAREAIAVVGEGRSAAGHTGRHPVAEFIMAVFADAPDAVPAARARLEAAWDHWDIAPERRDGVVGTPAEVAHQLQPWLDAGVTHLVLQPMEDADRTAFVRGAGETAALLRASTTPRG